MKRIIDGKTYNTETSTEVLRVFDLDHDTGTMRGEEVLFSTRHGAYFLCQFDYGVSGGQRLLPLDHSAAQSWLEKWGDAELVEHCFGEQPEAGETERRMTIRIPDALWSRIDRLRGEQAMNAWVMRCLETCSKAQEAAGAANE